MPTNISLSKIFSAAQQEATGAKTTAYALTTALTGIVYAIISVIIIALVPSPYELPAWATLAFLLAVSFSPIRYAMEELIRQVFPSTDYSSHALIKQLNAISYSTLTLDKLSQKFFDVFEVTLKISDAAILITLDENTNLTTHGKHSNLHKMSSKDRDYILRYLIEGPIITSSTKHEMLKKILLQYHIHYVFPLETDNNIIGALLLGAKSNNQPLTTKDHKVILATTPKLSYAVQNAIKYDQVTTKNSQLISDLKSTNQELRKANRELKKNDQLKDELVFIATHELKNPVTAIKGYLSLIEEGKYGKVSKKLADIHKQISASNQQLINLLNNLLQIARTEANRLELKTQSVAICDVIDRVIKDLEPLAKQKKLKIDHTCPNPAITIMSHPERLKEIINNLVSNAIKYSDKGIIKITHEISQDHLITHVADQGVGIPKKDQKKIFTRFFRVEEEAAKGIPGTGLGLFIIKEVIERMGGKIWFKSQPKKGSTFSFSFSLAHTPHLKSS